MHASWCANHALPPVPEHNVTLYVCPEVPDLHIKNILSENRTDFTVANNYLGLDPELTYTDSIKLSVKALHVG